MKEITLVEKLVQIEGIRPMLVMKNGKLSSEIALEVMPIGRGIRNTDVLHFLPLLALQDKRIRFNYLMINRLGFTCNDIGKS